MNNEVVKDSYEAIGKFETGCKNIGTFISFVAVPIAGFVFMVYERMANNGMLDDVKKLFKQSDIKG